ncbi:MAG: VCBS repeat-containing protein [Acidobacteria bacterium]|nr:VCBS repeat-containing protein [Acidobacteriota bacterium]
MRFKSVGQIDRVFLERLLTVFWAGIGVFVLTIGGAAMPDDSLLAQVVGKRFELRKLDDSGDAASFVPQTLRTLPGDNSVAAAYGDQSTPAVARGNDSILAVWTDNRPNPTSSAPFAGSEYETSRDIYGVRLDLAGNVLDAIPLAIVARRSNQTQPRISWNGSNWLVVYQSVDLGGTGYYQNSLEAVRVAPSGQVLDAKPIKLYGLTLANGWAVASDGNNWVVASQGTSATNSIVGMRISPAGVVLDPPTRVLVANTNNPRFGGLFAYASGVFAFFYNDDNGFKLGRFDSSLTPLGSAALAPDVWLTDLASNGTNFYRVWHKQNTNGLVNVVGSRINSAGAVLDGAGVNISGTKEPSANATTAVIWDGVNWRVTWGQLNTSWIARVNSAGTNLDPGSVAVAGIQTGRTAGAGAGALQMIWTIFANNNIDVFSANVSTSSVAGPTRTLSVGAPQQTRPDVAASGSGYMTVFLSRNAASSRVLAQPLDAAGNSLTPQPVELETGSSFNGPGNPSVAWNGSAYLVTWGTANGIVGQRLQANGIKIDASPFTIISGGFGPTDVAALGNDFLVAARKTGISIQFIFPVAARVNGSGAVLDASPLTLGQSYLRTAPAVVQIGGRWLAAWHRNATHDNSFCTTMGAFIEANGTLTPEFQIHGPFSTAGGNGIFEVGLASSGTKALLVQSQELTSGVETDLLARVVEASGTVGPQINLTPWQGNQYRPRASWDGSSFIIAYQDQKNSLAENSLEQLDARSDLFGMRVSPTGAVVDPQGFVFSNLPTGETDPTVCSLNGVTMFAGSAVINDTNFANYRIVYEQRDASQNKWPIAVANASAVGGDVPLTVDFSSAGSTDPDGSVSGFFWDFGDGATSTAANPTHTYTIAGPFVAELTVTDNGGAQAKQTVLVKARTPNQLPVAVATASPSSGQPPLDVIFYADGSYDPDGFLGNLEWTFSDGGTYYGSPAYHTFATTGTYTATLKVFDSQGAFATTSINVYVGTPTPTPTPTLTPTPTPTPTPIPARAAFDYDGDRKTDVSVYRPTTGGWYLDQSQGGSIERFFGLSTDKIAPADFDGDGKTDIAVYRPSTGVWHVLRSSDQSYFAVSFGISTDKPVPADYDGDGIADVAVFRASQGTWYINRSLGGVQITQWGISSDLPVPADYDGDRRSDIAIFRPSTGQWWLNRTTAGVTVETFGVSSDKPVPADYTGDGKADVAVWRPSNGNWFVLRSEDSSFYSAPFGLAADIPTPGDYDGDGKADFAVFRPTNLNWYVQRSALGVLARSFGATGDIPTPSAFAP